KCVKFTQSIVLVITQKSLNNHQSLLVVLEFVIEKFYVVQCPAKFPRTSNSAQMYSR
ncbi:29173_t:CDS:1, partial [Gigaspora margarita]